MLADSIVGRVHGEFTLIAIDLRRSGKHFQHRPLQAPNIFFKAFQTGQFLCHHLPFARGKLEPREIHTSRQIELM
jgi:hypothetical protein